MRKIILLTAVLSGLVMLPTRFAPLVAFSAAAGGETRAAVAPPPAPALNPIRTLPGLAEIRIWLGGSGTSFSFVPSNPALSERLDVLDRSSHDLQLAGAPGALDAYDIFYSSIGGSPQPSGEYLTIEAVSNSQAQGAGGGNVAEVGLKFAGAPAFEYGNLVTDFVALGSNAEPVSIGHAIDGNPQTFTKLGNTVGQTRRLRITIGFASSTGPAPEFPLLDLFNTTVTEGDAGTTEAVFILKLRTLSTLPITMNVTTRIADGYGVLSAPAVAGSDFMSASVRLTIPPGELAVQFRVPIIGDRVAEEEEWFQIEVSDLENAFCPINKTSCKILDNDRTILPRCSGELSLPVSSDHPLNAAMNVADNLIIQKITVGLFIETDNVQNITVRLKSPSGVIAPLLAALIMPGRDLGVGCDTNQLCILDEDGTSGIATRTASPPVVGRFAPSPEEAFNRFKGQNARGEWTLIVENNKGDNRTTLKCWCLGFEGALTGFGLQPNGVDVRAFTFITPTATVISNGAPVAGANVTFSIFDINPFILRGTFGPIQTDQNGQAMMAPYTNEGLAVDETSQLIRANVTINGAPYATFAEIHWRMNRCPFAEVAQRAPRAEVALAAAHGFRDRVLSQTSRGRRYTDQYYQFSAEAVQILMFNPMLILRSREIIERYKPVIESMTRGEPVTLTRGDLDEIDDFLNRFAARGSPQLQQAVKGVREDLRNPAVHHEFRISVTDGPKREMPAHPLLQSINRAGGAALLMGLLVAFARRLIRAGKPGSKARRWLCILLPIFILQPANVLLAHSAAKAKSGRDRSRTSIGSAGDRKRAAAASTAFDKLPLRFEANRGQMDARVRFMSRGDRYSLFLTPTEAALRLRAGEPSQQAANRLAARHAQDESPQTFVEMLNPQSMTGARQSLTRPAAVLRMKLVGANPAARMTGIDALAGRSNYFIGKDAARWRANIPTYARVKCEQVYPGIDMVYYGNHRELEYDFQLAPGADYRAIRLKFDGADRIEIDSQDDLVIRAADGAIRHRRPVVYQETGGGRRYIPARYIMGEAGYQNQNSAPGPQPPAPSSAPVVGFEIGAYDPALPLIIDPALAYSTYLGGGGDDEGNSIAVDAAGNLYVVGFTDSTDFPTTGASPFAPGGGQQDGFVAKLNPSGTQLIYSTYLGGDGQDNGSSIAVDAAGNAYITGFTGSTNFPVRNALQPTRSGPFNAFVMKLGPTGNLLYSTHLGGSAGDYGSSIAVDAAGNIYVAGVATSTNFPLAGAQQQQLGGGADVYVAKLNGSGRQLVYSTYLGGTDNDGTTGMAVDGSGSVYLTGVTASPDFRTASPLQAAHGGGLFDAFVARFNPAGQLVYSTYLGGSGEDRSFRIAVDAAGSAYVTGDTDSTNFPTASALQKSIGGSTDAFLAKLNESGTQLIYSTYLGGSQIDGGTAVAVDSAGRAYVAGFTGSTNFPTASPLQAVHGGGPFDGFLAKLNPSGAALDYATYLGGSDIDGAFGVAVDAGGNAYVMGQTASLDFPTATPLQPAYGGGASDVFVARITSAAKPHIGSAAIKGKKLLVTGSDFDQGAKILLNNQPQKTRNDDQNPTTGLIGKKAGKQISVGQAVILQVKNASGELSNEFSFTRPAP